MKNNKNIRFVDYIQAKKEGKHLSQEEIRQMICEYTNGTIPDYQMSAMLMAICFQGLSEEELSALTMAMMNSGEVVDLSAIKGIKVDKHSTGGVGDKTTLIVAPIVAAAGIPVAKMSGRGLGFTGGTIDKLESIPGFRTDLTKEQFFDAVNRIGLCVTGQSEDLAPADKKLYALRDVTATVESIPLIAASVMSKKLAAGSDKILLEVTTGSGAFIQDIEGSIELAKHMVAIGNRAGKETAAIITNMNEPLGFAIGNNLEVKEAIRALQGGGTGDLMEVCYALAANMIFLAREGYISYEDAIGLAKQKIEDGSALEKFKAMVGEQGGDVSYINNPDNFEVAKYSGKVCACKSGYIVSMNTAQIGVVSGMLGAGRETKNSQVDFCAGIVLTKKLGDYVKKGERIATLFSSQRERIQEAEKHMVQQYEISSQKPEKENLIIKKIIE